MRATEPMRRAVHAGLYVCDGAVIPCPLGIHPLLTITALAERAMILLARDYGWEMKEEAAPLRPAPVPSRRPWRPQPARRARVVGLGGWRR